MFPVITVIVPGVLSNLGPRVYIYVNVFIDVEPSSPNVLSGVGMGIFIEGTNRNGVEGSSTVLYPEVGDTFQTKDLGTRTAL